MLLLLVRGARGVRGFVAAQSACSQAQDFRGLARQAGGTCWERGKTAKCASAAYTSSVHAEDNPPEAHMLRGRWSF